MFLECLKFFAVFYFFFLTGLMVCVLCMIQTLGQEKRIKSMGGAVPGVTQTILLLGGGGCGPMFVSLSWVG